MTEAGEPVTRYVTVKLNEETDENDAPAARFIKRVGGNAKGLRKLFLAKCELIDLYKIFVRHGKKWGRDLSAEEKLALQGINAFIKKIGGDVEDERARL